MMRHTAYKITNYKFWQEQMDVISKLCNERYLALIEGESGRALLAFHSKPTVSAGVLDIRRQDHAEVPEPE
jgi:hypothetical protein